MIHKEYLIPLVEWLQARFPDILIPKDFVGYVIVVPISLDPKHIEEYDFRVRRTAQTVEMHAEYSKKYGGWIIQHMSEREKAEL